MGNLVADLGLGRQLIETHISWVFLGDHDVYKVKKPVNLSFLDFTRLSDRKRACDVEVVLNQRLTNGVYLGVVPVVRTPSGRHLIDGAPRDEASEIVDYAVHMRRLSDEHRWDWLLARGELSSARVAAFAEHLVRFHSTCSINPELAQLGTPEAIRVNVEENFAQLGDALQAYLPHSRATALPLLQHDFLNQHANVFTARSSEGKVRDGHGDLRLEHVYSEPTGIQVLDCIEFNDRFRYADVAADLAFITMDLRHNGRADLAEVLAASYAAATSDYELYRVLDFYESYRAVVRAKVTHIASSTKGRSDPQSATTRAKVVRYLNQAIEALRGRERTPRVVAVGGLIASGKSHTASEVSALLQCPVIATDRLRKHLHHAEPHQHLDAAQFSGAYSEANTARIYELLLESARHVLHSGRSVVLDATFRQASERERLMNFCQTNGVPLYFVECKADETTLRQRLRQREEQRTISDARESLLDEFMRRYEPPVEAQVGQLCQLDTTLPDTERTRILARFLHT